MFNWTAEQWMKVASAAVVTVVTSIGCLSLFQIFAMRDQIGTLAAEVERVAIFEDIVERVVRLEVSERDTPHAQLSSASNQFPSDQPTAIKMEFVDSLSGIMFDPKRSPTKIVIQHPGDYFLVLGAQLQRKGEYNQYACFDMWIELNEEDLLNSAVRQCWGSDTYAHDTDVLMLQTIIKLDEGDTIRLMMRSIPGEFSGLITIINGDIPLTPAIITSIMKVS